MYGMPQPNTYGQYGFGAYGAFPNQAAAGTGAAAPGMPSPVAPTAAMGMGAAQTPVDATAQAAGQWGSADPSSYYSNYWGGEHSAVVASHSPRAAGADVARVRHPGYYGQQAPGAAAPDAQGQA